MSDEQYLIPKAVAVPPKQPKDWNRLVSIAALLVSGLAAFYSFQQAKWSHQAFVAATRPLLELVNPTYKDSHGFHYILRNSGKSTAIRVRHRSHFELWRSYLSHYDSVPKSFRPGIWESWHIKIYQPSATATELLLDLPSDAVISKCNDYGTEPERRLEALYTTFPSIWQSDVNAAMLLFRGEFTYADMEGGEYRLPYCFEEWRLPPDSGFPTVIGPCQSNELVK